MEKKVVDALGRQCPEPVVMATKALRELQGAGVLEVHVDNEVAVQNLLRLAGGKGLPARSEKLAEGRFVVTLTADGALPAEEPAAACAPDKRGSTVVAVGAAEMGRGDEQLGRTLMKGFLFALSQLEELPRTILFYNGGATIPIEGSVSVEDLKSMEAQGVEILTCGTCLDFYGLTDCLAVGSVTNMYHIVEVLSNAEKVIKP